MMNSEEELAKLAAKLENEKAMAHAISARLRFLVKDAHIEMLEVVAQLGMISLTLTTDMSLSGFTYALSYQSVFHKNPEWWFVPAFIGVFVWSLAGLILEKRSLRTSSLFTMALIFLSYAIVVGMSISRVDSPSVSQVLTMHAFCIYFFAASWSYIRIIREAAATNGIAKKREELWKNSGNDSSTGTSARVPRTLLSRLFHSRRLH